MWIERLSRIFFQPESITVVTVWAKRHAVGSWPVRESNSFLVKKQWECSHTLSFVVVRIFHWCWKSKQNIICEPQHKSTAQWVSYLAIRWQASQSWITGHLYTLLQGNILKRTILQKQKKRINMVINDSNFTQTSKKLSMFYRNCFLQWLGEGMDELQTKPR